MRIDEFKLEKWLNPRDGCKYNLGASCVKAYTMDELFQVIGEDMEAFVEELKSLSLHYGPFAGNERLLTALSKMYKGVSPDMVLTVHGGTGANDMVADELLEQGDNIVVFMPNYQQHYSGPQCLGIETRFLELKEEDGYLPNLEALQGLIDEKTKMIVFTNPNNPTGAYMGEEMLKEIANIAREADAYVLSDEIYKGLMPQYMPSMVDLYEKAVVTNSTSKVFSMAGLRIGWVVTKDRQALERLTNRRSYNTVSDGVFDEWLAAMAFEHYDKILERSRKIVEKSKAIFKEWMKTQPHLSCDYEGWGTTVLVKYDYDIPSDVLCRDIFEKTDVLLCYGDCFEAPHSFRLGYSFGKPEVFAEGLKQLGNYFKELDQKPAE